MLERGSESQRLEHAADVEEAPKRPADLDRQIEQLERMRDAPTREQDVGDRNATERPRSSVSDYSRDSSPER
jgi:hypothetical protein